MNKSDQIKRILEIENIFNEKNKNKKKSVWDLFNSLHSIPVLRDWITLESLPLLPLAEKTERGLLLNVFLSTEKSKELLFKPWGFVAIEWPETRVLSMNKVSFLWKEEMVFRKSFLCNRSFAEMIQLCRENNEKLPLPPNELLMAYLKIKQQYGDVNV